jgi:hypothetical protein
MVPLPVISPHRLSSPRGAGHHLELIATFDASCVASDNGATGYGLAVLNSTSVSWNGTYLVVNGPRVSNGVDGGHYSPSVSLSHSHSHSHSGSHSGSGSGSGSGVNGGHYSPLELRQGEALSLHVYIDGGAIEVIANNRTLVTAVVLPPSDAFVHVGIVGCASPLRHYEAYVLKDLGPPRPRDMLP